MEQSNLRKFLALKISAFESMTTNFQNLEEDNCHWQWMCYETPLRFNISLREIFSKWGSPRVLKKSGKSALMEIIQEFETLLYDDSKNGTRKFEEVFGLRDNGIWITGDIFSEYNCDWQSICYERSLRFNLSLREIFSKSGSPIVMKKYDESALMQISQDFGTL